MNVPSGASSTTVFGGGSQRERGPVVAERTHGRLDGVFGAADAEFVRILLAGLVVGAVHVHGALLGAGMRCDEQEQGDGERGEQPCGRIIWESSESRIRRAGDRSPRVATLTQCHAAPIATQSGNRMADFGETI